MDHTNITVVQGIGSGNGIVSEIYGRKIWLKAMDVFIGLLNFRFIITIKEVFKTMLSINVTIPLTPKGIKVI